MSQHLRKSKRDRWLCVSLSTSLFDCMADRHMSAAEFIRMAIAKGDANRVDASLAREVRREWRIISLRVSDATIGRLRRLQNTLHITASEATELCCWSVFMPILVFEVPEIRFEHRA